MKPTQVWYHSPITIKSGTLALSEKEVEKLLLSIGNLRDKVLISLAIATGLRREDIVGILKKDVDLKHNTITYYEKKKKRTRTVPIGNKMSNLLEMYLHTLDTKNPWLFPSPKKGKYAKSHMSGRQAYDIFNEALDKIGLKRRPFHALRATCVKLAQKRGWKIEEVMELTGDSYRTISLHYATPSQDEMKEIATEKEIL